LYNFTACINLSADELKYPLAFSSGLANPPGTIPQLYCKAGLTATGFGCHCFTYQLNSHWLPKTIKMQAARIKAIFLKERFFTIQAKISKTINQLKGDRTQDNTAEANWCMKWNF